MLREPGIPGTIAEESRGLRWFRIPSGDRDGPRAYKAETKDGFLIAMVGQEPAGKDSKLLWHISVSHRDADNKPDRVPTWDELKNAAYRLIQVDVRLVLEFPKRSEPYVDIYETCLHLWESEEP